MAEPKPYVLTIGTINPAPKTKVCFELYADDRLYEIAGFHLALTCFDRRADMRAYTVNPRWDAVSVEAQLRLMLDKSIIADSGDFLFGVYPREKIYIEWYGVRQAEAG